MGKGNRTRTQRAAEVVFSANKNTGKASEKNANRITALVVTLVALLIVGCILLSLSVNTGFFSRSKTAAKSDNFKVTGTMLSYYFFYQYNSFLSQYGSYISYLGIDTGKSLKSQLYSENETWYQYFMNSIRDELEQYLVLCEAARAAGISLDDDEKKAIDDDIASIAESAKQYGYTTNTMLARMYGNGVTANDVKKALELSVLASKYYAQIYDELEAAVTENDIDNEIKENKANYYTADTLQFSFTASLSAAAAEATDEEKARFETDKADAKAKAEALLSAAVSAEAFKKAVADELLTRFDSKFEAEYASASSSLDDASKPTDEQLASAKADILAYITKVLSDDETAEAPDFGEATYASALRTTASSLYTYFYTDNYGSLEKKNISWADPSGEDTDELDKWLFGDGIKENDSKLVESETTSSASYTVAVVTSPSHRNESQTKNVAHILISSSTAGYDEDDTDQSKAASSLAKAKAEEVLAQYRAGEQTLDAFKTLAKQYTEDGSVEYKNVVEDYMVASFNDWLFDEARQVGDVEIVETEYGFHIMYFEGDGLVKWKADATSSVAANKFADWVKENSSKFHVTFNDKVLASVNA